jgi:hypothetical protein
MTTRKVSRGRKSAGVGQTAGARSAALRHGAITRTLPSYSSYKRWSDQLKSGWEGSEEPNR